MKYLAVAAAAVVSVAAGSTTVPAPPVPAIAETYRISAEHGNVRAQAALGLMLLGDDADAASRWLTAAARHGDGPSQISLADMLRKKHRFEEAAYWYSKASKGSARAVYLLGTMFEAGEGVERSSAAAARLYRSAALDGMAAAATRMGNLCMIGEGVPQDYVEARHWYLRAAALGDGDAFLDLAGLFYRGLGVRRDVDEARRWALAAKRVQARDADAVLAVIETKD